MIPYLSFADLATLNSRHAILELSAAGVAMTADIADMVESFSFTEHGHGKADDINVKFSDADHLWKTGWAPGKADKLVAAIVCRNWFQAGDEVVLSCGTFTCDELEISGPPDVATVKGVSAYVDTPLRQQENTRAWEGVGLQQIAQDIAGRHGLSLFWEAEDVQLDRVEQRQEGDLPFLKRVAEKYGINVKVADDKLTLFGGKEADAQAPALTIVRGQSDISRFSFRTQSTEIFGGSQVDYWDPETKQVVTHSHQPAGAPPVGQTKKPNKRVKSKAEAQRVAESELRESNKNEISGSIDCLGLPTLYAGQVIGLEGWGLFDGNYYVESMAHKLDRSQGYTSSISVRRTLDY